ncbi:YbaB/EbfC family nucleoid-associated protein [Helicobacter sp. MIT 01-3238]|uniref:YbaB/EbfC family nucleoid-associated protein n=1 Tax=Helicobacter sp. MIT 01-3238 TaxID=398627 RepID=UPI000E1FA844|nr:YbaB/EbfC family nucleoid-associated protein [Helicobacter sp. MIT 01-3238]RDU53417.1 nucleoid-associated protein, YbaB/EbfC family [Helicobacter sp. MIT 01-3238]
MFDIKNLSQMLGGMQEQIQEMEQKSKDTILTAKSGGGLLTVSINGAGEVVDILIDDSLLEDKESLQILLISALNDAYKNVEENRKSLALGMLGKINPF